MASLRLYNVGIFGGVPDDSARAAGSASGDVDPGLGHRFGPEELDRFEEELRGAAEGGRGLSIRPALLGGEELGLRVTFPAEDDVDAYSTVRGMYLAAFRAAFGFSPEVDECEVVLQEKFEERERRQLAEGHAVRGAGEVALLGPSGAARVLGLTPQRVDQLERARAAGERLDFPAPWARFDDGRPGWLPEDIEAFGRHRRRAGVRATSDAPLPLPGLRRARLARSWSQEALARESGVGRVTISNLETGKGTKRENLRKLARALEVREEVLLAPPSDRAGPATTETPRRR